MKYTVNVIDKVGFSCYDVVDILDVVDLGDTYNLITGTGDIFLDKEYCYVTKKIMGEYSFVSSIEYNTESLNVYIESVETLEGVIAC